MARLQEELEASAVRNDGVLKELEESRAIVDDKSRLEASLREEGEGLHVQLEELECDVFSFFLCRTLFYF